MAGYCYEWKTKNNMSSNASDIDFPEYDFKMKSNLNNTQTLAKEKQDFL